MHDDGVPFIQHDYEKSRARHDQEVKLIISAWYNMVSERVNTQKLKQELHPHHPIPHSFIFLFPPPSLPVREWGCIRKCLVSGWAPPTRPCPSSPSRDNSPTQGEAWHDTTRDETRRRDSYPQMKSKVHTRWSMWSLSVFCLFYAFTGITVPQFCHAAAAPCWLLLIWEDFFSPLGSRAEALCSD